MRIDRSSFALEKRLTVAQQF